MSFKHVSFILNNSETFFSKQMPGRAAARANARARIAPCTISENNNVKKNERFFCFAILAPCAEWCDAPHPIILENHFDLFPVEVVIPPPS